MARIKEGCDCGCNDPVATNPKDMLIFLANRFEHGVSESVAHIYQYDIRLILKEHYGIESEARVQDKDN
jgi:hypothetical protein